MKDKANSKNNFMLTKVGAQKKGNPLSSARGITLVAVAITIIIIAILVSVSVKIAHDNGLIGHTADVTEGFKWQQAREVLITHLEEQKVHSAEEGIRLRTERIQKVKDFLGKDNIHLGEATSEEDGKLTLSEEKGVYPAVQVVVDGYTFWVDGDLNILEEGNTSGGETNPDEGNPEDPGTKTTYYEVQHYVPSADRSTYEKKRTEVKTGVIGHQVTAQAVDFPGFEFDEHNSLNVLTGKVSTETRLVLKVYYKRIEYTVHYNGNGHTSGNTEDSVHTYDVEAPLTKNGYQKQYRLTYDLNGGEGETSQEVAYTFEGWKTSVEATSAEYEDMQKVTNLTEGSEITLYAHWSGGSITLPHPTKAGEDFKGWYSDQELKHFVGNAEDPYVVTQDQTLYAKWETKGAVNYTIEIYEEKANENGYSLIETKTSQAIPETTVNLQELGASNVPANDIFNEEETSKHNSNLSIAEDGSTKISLYYNRQKYQLTLLTNNSDHITYFTGVSGAGSYKWGQNVEIDATLTVEDARWKFVWEKWKSNNATLLGDQNEQRTTITMPKGEITLTATATRITKEYTLTLDSTTNGGTDISVNGESKGVSIELARAYGGDLELDNIVATKPGWDFVGWNTNSNATEAMAEGFTMPEENLTVYAIFKKTITVTLQDYTNESASPTTRTIQSDMYNNQTETEVTLPNLNTRTNWTAAGWTTLSNEFDVEVEQNTPVTISESKTYYGIYEATGTVSYDKNGGSEEAPSATTGTVSFNSAGNTHWPTVTLASYTGTKEGYTLTGWNTNQEGTGDTYGISGDYTLSALSTTLYAKWNRDPHTLTVYPGGQTYTQDFQSTLKVDAPRQNWTIHFQVNGGSEVEDLPKRSVFSSWTLSADAKGSISNETDNPVTYTFGSGDDSLTANYTHPRFLLPSSTKEGHHLVWCKDEDLTQEVGQPNEYYTIPNDATTHGLEEEITLYAKWVPNQYHIQLSFKVDGNTFDNGNLGTDAERVKAKVTIAGMDKGYVSGLDEAFDYGTAWEVSKLQIDGEEVDYHAQGTLGTENQTIEIPLNTLTIAINPEGMGKASRGNVLVVNGTTYSTNDNQLTLSDGRSVIVTSTEQVGYTNELSDWTPSNGTISDATTVTANFNHIPGQFNVTINPSPANGGTYEGNGMKTVGTTVTIKATPKAGYDGVAPKFSSSQVTLSESKKNDDGSYQVQFQMPTQNVNIAIKFTPNTYTVHYNGNGETGGTVADSTHQYQIPKSLNANTFEKQYTVTFDPNEGDLEETTQTATYAPDGWATSPEGAKQYGDDYKNSDLTTKNNDTVQLYAHWTGGSISLPTPTRASYQFAGWYTDKENGDYVGRAGDSYTPTADKITLYARWTQKAEVNYTVDIYQEKADDTTYEKISSQTLKAIPETSVSLETLGNSKKPANDTFDKTETVKQNGNKENIQIAESGNTHISLYYKRETYQLTLSKRNQNNITYIKSVTGEGTYKWGQTVSIQATLAENTAEYTYEWQKWESQNKALLADVPTQNTTITMPKGSITLEAVATRKANEYTLTWDAKTNGGTGTDVTETKAYGTAIDLGSHSKPTKTGWIFIGWNTDKTANTNLTTFSMPAQNTTLYAIFKKTVTVTLQEYTGSDMTSRTVTGTRYNNEESANITLPSLNTRTDWTAKGWTTDKNNVEVQATGNKAVSVAEDTTYYGIYETTGRVHYNINGGSGTAPSDTTGTVTNVTDGKTNWPTVTLATYDGEKTGYTNTHKWNTTELGNGESYNAGSQYTLKALSTTLYVDWSSGINQYTLTVNPGGQTQEKKYHEQITVNAPTKTYQIHYEVDGGSTVQDEQKQAPFANSWNLTKTDGTTPAYGTLTSTTTSPTTYTFGAGDDILTATYGQVSINLPTSTKEGHRLEWYSDSGKTHKVGTSGSTYAIPKDETNNTNVTITLYAKWIPNQYTLTVDPNGGTWNGDKKQQSVTQAYGSSKELGEATPPTITYAGNGGTPNSTPQYTFDKWSQTGAGSLVGTKYTFGVGTGTVTASYTRVTLPGATKQGYVFTGWSDEETTYPAGTEYPPQEGDYYFDPDVNFKDVTLTAQWKAANDTTYTIEYYKENINNATTNNTAGYTKFATVTAHGTTESTVTLTEQQKNEKQPTGFESAGTFSVTSGTITADGKLTLKIYYPRKQYQVTVNAGKGGSVSGAATYDYEADVTLTATTNLGYHATNPAWSNKPTEASESVTSNDSGQKISTVKFKMPANQLTMEVTFTPNTYTVHYEGNGATGGKVENSTHQYQVEQALNANTFEKKYTITLNPNGGKVEGSSTNITKTATCTAQSGWAKSAAGNIEVADKYNKSDLTTTHNATVNLYAKWNPAGSITLPDATPSVSTKKFIGWYTNQTAGDKVDTNYTAPSDITLYARYDTRATVSYTVEIWEENADNTNYTKKTTLTGLSDIAGTTLSFDTLGAKYGKGDQSNLTDLKNDTYDASVTKSNNSSQSSVTLTEGNSPTIKLYYKRKTFDLTLAKNSGISSITNEGKKSYKWGAKVTLSASLKTNDPYYNYTWYRWTSSNTSIQQHISSQNTTFTMPAGSFTLTAEAKQSTPKTYQLTLDAGYNGGYFQGGSSGSYYGGSYYGDGYHQTTLTLSVPYGERISGVLASIPQAVKPGYQPLGWSKDTGGYNNLLKDDETMPSSSLTLYAQYDRTVKATATFKHYNGTTPKTETSEATTTVYNNGSLPNSINVSVPTMGTYTGATRVRWTTGTGANDSTNSLSYTASTVAIPLSNGSYNRTYYAVYSYPITITLDENGGSTTVSNKSGTGYWNSYNINTKEGASIALPTYSGTKTGYKASSWYSNSSGSGGTIYNFNGTYSFTSSTTLYIRWDIQQYTLTVNPGGATYKGNYNSTLTVTAPKQTYKVTYQSGNKSGSQDVERPWSKWSLNAGAKGSLTQSSTKTATYKFGAGNDTLTASYSNPTITLPDAASSTNSYYVTGKTFDGWFTDSSYRNSAGKGNARYTITGNTTFYAKWR